VLSTTIAFMGTGLMGAPMARRLAGANFRVAAWNRNIAKARTLADCGVRVADTAAEAVRDVDVVILMLLNGAACEEVLFGDEGIGAALKPGSIVLDMSSISPRLATNLSTRLAERGLSYMDAPVSGGTRGAAAGTLAIMAGGDEALFQELLPVFAPLGTATRVGPTGMGQLAKLANQAIVGITIGAVAEALLLAQAAGADPGQVREALLSGFAGSRILMEHGLRMIERDFTAGGQVVNQVKDLDTLLDTARDFDLTLPFSSLAAELFRALAGDGDGHLDHSALLLRLERMNRK
jgi:2-hydroxy-3-oxopropionate reductase